MPQMEKHPDDFRRVLREKALNHSLFYLKLGSGADKRETKPREPKPTISPCARVAPNPRKDSGRVFELARKFDKPMQYLRPPRNPTPTSDDTADICSSDDDDRAAVRRRSRELSDDSAVEVDPPRKHHQHPRPITPPAEDVTPRKERMLVEAHDVELGGRRGSVGQPEVAARKVRTPSVVVSDYSDGSVFVGATAEEASWLRSRSLSADSACSSCSTLSSREEDELDSPALVKKMYNAL